MVFNIEGGSNNYKQSEQTERLNEVVFTRSGAGSPAWVARGHAPLPKKICYILCAKMHNFRPFLVQIYRNIRFLVVARGQPSLRKYVFGETYAQFQSFSVKI